MLVVVANGTDPLSLDQRCMARTTSSPDDPAGMLIVTFVADWPLIVEFVPNVPMPGMYVWPGANAMFA
jgi:hypothetical protein